MKQPRVPERGTVLLLVTLVGIVAVGIGMTALSLTSSQARSSQTMNGQVVCRYAAEAAIETAWFRFQRDLDTGSPTWFERYGDEDRSVTPVFVPLAGFPTADRARVDLRLLDSSDNPELPDDVFELEAVAVLDRASYTARLRFQYVQSEQTSQTTGNDNSPPNYFSKYVWFVDQKNTSAVFAPGSYYGRIHSNEWLGFGAGYPYAFDGKVTASLGFSERYGWGWRDMTDYSFFLDGYDEEAPPIDMPEYANIENDLRPVARGYVDDPERAALYVSLENPLYGDQMDELRGTEISFVFDESEGRSRAILRVNGYNTEEATSWRLLTGRSIRTRVDRSSRTRYPEATDPDHEHTWLRRRESRRYYYYRLDSGGSRLRGNPSTWTTETTTRRTPKQVVREVEVPNDGSGLLIFSDPKVTSLKGMLHGRVTVTTPHDASASNPFNVDNTNYSVKITDDLVYVDQDGDPAWWAYQRDSSVFYETTEDTGGNRYSHAPMAASGRVIDSDTEGNEYRYEFRGMSTHGAYNINTDQTDWDSSFVSPDTGSGRYFGPNLGYTPDHSSVLGIMAPGDVYWGPEVQRNTIQNFAYFSPAGTYRSPLGSPKNNLGFVGSLAQHHGGSIASGSGGFRGRTHRIFDDRLVSDTPPPYWIEIPANLQTVTDEVTTVVSIKRGALFSSR